MIDKYETVIKKQQEMHDLLQKQLDADKVIINAQKQQIQQLKENVAILEKEKAKLIDAGNKLSQSNAHLDEICAKQQTLLEELIDMMKRSEQ